ncbi:MAG: phospholipase D-like domain-containing protein [Gammaproteobacteria bacterium]|nr:phospholipase D-like domain-containing protein [Gammaproteobacteria bacterium]MDH4256149.1 phospholipase D-like domain-containing protein [Gammaproteobacteria bacterium]MDH5311253.1 phospholipase D-like domain-containing protein [Gammaproteobacteria bacterium]
MGPPKPKRRWWRRGLPPGVSFAGPPRPATGVEFLTDTTWLDDAGRRHVDQQIFDAVFAMIRAARRCVLVDMFLYNDFQGSMPERTRLLSGELTEVLLARRRAVPDIRIVVITDPINIVYGSVVSGQFERLRAAGIPVVITDLTRLPDGNIPYSFLWRLIAKPFGVGPGKALRNPFDARGRVSLRSYLYGLNFKANHRKLVVADDGDGWAGLVSSANPHDASSAHHNVAIRFRGAAVADLLETENAVLRFSGAQPVDQDVDTDTATSPVTVAVVTERAIKNAALDLIDTAGPGERLDLATFYLSDRAVIRALKRAHVRGAALRVLLDPSKDAFGYEKNGIPNQPVAAELQRAGIPVRWVHTHGEQCHVKMLIRTDGSGQGALLIGSANLTRRNLDDFNLETNLLLRAAPAEPCLADACRHFERLWNNEPGRLFSVGYEHYRDESLLKKWKYRWMEASGMSTF